MPISSLKNLSVPIDDGGSQNQGLLMPKLQYRFRVLFTSFGTGASSAELTRQVMDVTRPNVTFEDITLHAYNSRVRLAGKHSWEDVTITIRDDASCSVQKLVGAQLQKQIDFAEQKTAAAGSSYKFVTKIELLDGGNGAFNPGILETWELYGCYLTGANYNSLNYSTSDAVTITLNVRFDNAAQLTGTTPPDTLAIGIDTANKK